MIKLTGKIIHTSKYFLLFQLLKKQEFIINLGSLGVRFEKISTWNYEISIVALGKDFGDNLYLTAEQLVRLEKRKETPKKPEATHHEDEGSVVEEDLF
jgi:hypothetical protein